MKRMRSLSCPSRSAFGQRGDDVGQGSEVDALAGLDRLDAERGGEVGLAGSRRAQQVDDLLAGDEGELGERQDAVAVERGLEGEVEAVEGLERAQPGGHQGDLDAPRLAHGQFLAEQLLERFQG